MTTKKGQKRVYVEEEGKAYAASAALVTHGACVQPRPQPKHALTDFGLQPHSHSLPFNGIHPRNPRKYVDYV